MLIGACEVDVDELMASRSRPLLVELRDTICWSDRATAKLLLILIDRDRMPGVGTLPIFVCDLVMISGMWPLYLDNIITKILMVLVK
ncbi:hypothetical protein PPL_04163 [Heterostelium album PN500]|uniref:Uncharacterized protein n=1 Tax=Heterostelium pallidum (strain ATCC 26659 / Pp 5 / PN500) TaxID=670386 RepID=D3B672_HETP5|nr:hypothetical protein PPL_04163 [Heterostelium album PN500]EFA83370.1 hypothetical protein PPL_04163 [Heterostelium album PN500]|eukprot:XP_020435487.1 hypothetical protein PPL_04163 [Heterostelium album PN500]